MLIRELRLRDYRNYTELHLRPGRGLNILIGVNAQGKSNLLEAIYTLATTRSLRAGRESEVIRHGADAAAIQVVLERADIPETHLDIGILQGDRKTVRVNGSRRGKVIELLGTLNAVFFGSADLGIVSGEPSFRRRHLNIEISQISPKYCFDLAAYKKVIEQRNRLLRDMRDRPSLEGGLEAWDEQLVRYAAPIIEKRRMFTDRLAPLADEMHHRITDGRESLELRYVPNVPLPLETAAPEIEGIVRSELKRVAGEERRRGTSLVGPQRDDLQFLINGVDARMYGSQGQQRTVILSVKLAQFALMQEYTGETPIMLLDDVMSDLDDMRRKHLVEWTRQGAQTFVTCTNLRTFPPEVLAEAQVLRVRAGTIAPVDAPGSATLDTSCNG